MPNLYYDPEHFGLEKVVEFERSEPCYSFDTFVVWCHKETGTYYWGYDSGCSRHSRCSCPSPFEDLGYNETDSRTVNLLAVEEILSELGSGTVYQAAHVIIDSVGLSYDRDYSMSEIGPAMTALFRFESSRDKD